MKTALKTSIVLNLILLGSLCFIWCDRRGETALTKPPPEVLLTQPSLEQVTVPLAVEPKPQKFRWSYLQSPDYRTFVNNLRMIGCPEMTLRAIVVAEVSAGYRVRRQELEQKLSALEKSSWSEQLKNNAIQQAWRAELQQLALAQAADIADIMRSPANLVLEAAPPMTATFPTKTVEVRAEQPAGSPKTVKVATASPLAGTAVVITEAEASAPHSSSGSNSSSAAAPVYPLVFQEVDPAVLKLNAQQIQVVAELRATFVEEIGGLNQDPNDPDYLDRWLKAQTKMDSLTQGFLGVMAWETYQVATWDH